MYKASLGFNGGSVEKDEARESGSKMFFKFSLPLFIGQGVFGEETPHYHYSEKVAKRSRIYDICWAHDSRGA